MSIKLIILFILIILYSIFVFCISPRLNIVNKSAVAVFSGNITGTTTFKQTLNGVIVNVNLDGVPDGEHGFHIHEFGDLTKGCDSLCDHLNPYNVSHGGLVNGRTTGHMGDLGNVKSINGKVQCEFLAKDLTLNGPYSIIGRSIILHADRDNLGLLDDPESQKTGRSGERIACAVIGLSSECD